MGDAMQFGKMKKKKRLYLLYIYYSIFRNSKSLAIGGCGNRKKTIGLCKRR